MPRAYSWAAVVRQLLAGRSLLTGTSYVETRIDLRVIISRIRVGITFGETRHAKTKTAQVHRPRQHFDAVGKIVKAIRSILQAFFSVFTIPTRIGISRKDASCRLSISAQKALPRR